MTLDMVFSAGFVMRAEYRNLAAIRHTKRAEDICIRKSDSN